MADHATAAAVTGTSSARCAAERRIITSSPDRFGGVQSLVNDSAGYWQAGPVLGTEVEGR
jgi:hypothetical protein